MGSERGIECVVLVGFYVFINDLCDSLVQGLLVLELG